MAKNGGKHGWLVPIIVGVGIGWLFSTTLTKFIMPINPIPKMIHPYSGDYGSEGFEAFAGEYDWKHAGPTVAY